MGLITNTQLIFSSVLIILCMVFFPSLSLSAPSNQFYFKNKEKTIKATDETNSEKKPSRAELRRQKRESKKNSQIDVDSPSREIASDQEEVLEEDSKIEQDLTEQEESNGILIIDNNTNDVPYYLKANQAESDYFCINRHLNNPVASLMDLGVSSRELEYKNIIDSPINYNGNTSTCGETCKTSELTTSSLRKSPASCKILQDSCQKSCSLLPWDNHIEFSEMNKRFMSIIDIQADSYKNTDKIKSFDYAQYIAPCIIAGAETIRLDPIRTHSGFCTSKTFSSAVGLGQITKTTFYDSFGLVRTDVSNGCGNLTLKQLEDYKLNSDPITVQNNNGAPIKCSPDKNRVQSSLLVSDPIDRSLYLNLSLNELYDRMVFDVKLQSLLILAVLENTPGKSLLTTIKNYGTGTDSYYNKFNKCFDCMKRPGVRWQFGMQTGTVKGKKVSGPGWGCMPLK